MENFFINFAVVLACLIFFIFLVFQKKFTAPEIIFGYYIGINAVFETIAKLTSFLGYENNLPGLHAYTLVKYIVLCAFTGVVIQKLGLLYRWKLVLIFGAVAIILNSIFIQDIYSFNSYSASGVELFVVLSSVTIFLLKLKPNLNIQIGLKPLIIFTIACFVKSCFSIMIYLYSTEIAKMAKAFEVKLWLINVLINITASCIILYGIVLIIRRKEKPIFSTG